MVLRVCYALCGTALAYAATRFAVLRLRMLLRAMRYCACVGCYALCGAALGTALQGARVWQYQKTSPVQQALLRQCTIDPTRP
eukprot:1558433-Rhodomonas_salina.1